MNHPLTILILEAMVVYFLVLAAHSLRRRVGLPPFYAVIGGITAIMSWVTDAGVRVDIGNISFMVGSTVFYTSLLLGVFVVYVFDGPRATRVAILTVAGVSIMVPLIALALHVQSRLSGHADLGQVPEPSLRINTASVVATICDLVFLAMAWEFLGKPKLHIPLYLRSFLTLLGVMWLDVLLFATGAFAGTPAYLQIMTGTFTSRFVISVFAFPFLYMYINWQNRKVGVSIENRPVLAILREVGEIRAELSLAQEEIEQRKKLEREREALIADLHDALSRVRTLQGLLPTCSNCKKIRDEEGDWHHIEEYIQDRSEAVFTHGLCPDCADKLYPELRGKMH